MNSTDQFIAEVKRWNAEHDARVKAEVRSLIRSRRLDEWLLIGLHLIVPFCIAITIGLLIYLMPEGV